MKKYIFFTYQIHRIGGTQMVVAGKAAYLEKHGWEVYVFTSGKSCGKSQISTLTKYIAGCGFKELSDRPYKMSDQNRDQLLNKMVDILRIDETIENEIIIESHYDVAAYWAELLAERIHARHFFFLCNEKYRDCVGRFYEENLDFFYFKYIRHEMFAETAAKNQTFERLFNGHRGVTRSPITIPDGVEMIKEQDAIQDVENPIVDSNIFTDADFSIAYISRTEKQYFLPICQGVVEFAQKYRDQTIQFVIVGNFVYNHVLESMNSIFDKVSNVKIVKLGALVPIPKNLFKKLDLVISGGQTAIFCAYENVPVIIANAETDKTSGCLYYDTEDFLYGCDNTPINYVDAIEHVLIDRAYDNRTQNLPERYPADWHYEKALELQRANQFPLEYFTEKFKQDLRRNWVVLFPFKYIERGAKIVIYGAGEISRDYQEQMKDYCELIAVVADDYEHYDRTILSPEKLSELVYDEIVIAELPERPRIDKIIDRILQITGHSNVTYDWNPILV